MPADRHPDCERVERARAGEPEARAWLVEQLQRARSMARHAAGRVAGGRDVDVDDAAQEAAVIAIRRLGDFEGRSAFSGWLYTICAWTVRGMVRRRRREQLPGLEFDPEGDGAPPAELAADEDLRARVRRALAGLGGVEADIIRMRHFDLLDFRDIAVRLGIPFATVRTRYYRGLKRLRRRLDDLDPDS